jgi:hypothetical protein
MMGSARQNIGVASMNGPSLLVASIGFRASPALQNLFNLVAHRCPGLEAIPPATEQPVVPRVYVTHVGAHSESNCLGVEALGIGGPANTAGVLRACVVGDRGGLVVWASRVKLADACCEIDSIPRIGDLIALGPTFPNAIPGIGIRQALLFGACQRVFLDEKALAFISVARSTEADDDRLERGVLGGAARQRRIAARQEDQVREVCARHAERALTLEAEQSTAAELIAALCTSRVADDLEHHDLVALRRFRRVDHATESILPH